MVFRMTWQPELYLRFKKERTQPCIDLAARLSVTEPKEIIDLGCGPGNSTEILRNTYPDARIVGVDNSLEMLERARQSGVRAEWQSGDIQTWSHEGSCDVIFSNAAIHWVPDQAALLPRLVGYLRSGGQLAIQLPVQMETRVHQCIRELALQSRWWPKLESALHTRVSLSAGEYYNILAPLCTCVEIWQTDYYHVMDRADDIVAWIRGTGLRPFLALLSEDEQGDFLAQYTDAIRASYPASTDGKVLYPYRRIFMIATAA